MRCEDRPRVAARAAYTLVEVTVVLVIMGVLLSAGPASILAVARIGEGRRGRGQSPRHLDGGADLLAGQPDLHRRPATCSAASTLLDPSIAGEHVLQLPGDRGRFGDASPPRRSGRAVRPGRAP